MYHFTRNNLVLSFFLDPNYLRFRINYTILKNDTHHFPLKQKYEILNQKIKNNITIQFKKFGIIKIQKRKGLSR